MRVPFNLSSVGERELSAVSRAIDNGWLSGNGPFGKSAEQKLSTIHEGSGVLLTSSCTSALEMAVRLLGAEPGSEVIVPSWTFVTTASAVVAGGLVPVFADIDPESLGVSRETVESVITEKTVGIMAVHYGGFPADPEGLKSLSVSAGVSLIEDNAHGLGNRSDATGQTIGTFGSMSTLSFHETKNISCGEGGALVVNDPSLMARAEILREKGTDRAAFSRGIVDKYTWRDLGSSWVLSEVQAAILDTQLDRIEELQRGRRVIWETYRARLLDWACAQEVQLPSARLGSSHHNFFLIFPEESSVEPFIEHMKKQGVQAVRHYEPLHQSPYAVEALGIHVNLPVTERVSAGLVRLPLYFGLSAEEVEHVVVSVQSFPVGVSE